MRRIGFVTGVCVLALLAALRARADEPVPSLLNGFNLTSWTQKDGITAPLIWSLAQDDTGYLWIGTDGGLLRFDGVRFVRWEELASIPNPQASVRSLCAARDGALWFGLGEPGGIGVLRNGSVRMYGIADGLPPGVVMSLVTGREGTLWAGGLFGVFRLVADRWERSVEGLPPGLVNALFVDPDGSLLAATAEGVYARPSDGSMCARVGPFDEQARALARGADGRIWVTDPIVGFRLVRESRGAALDAQKGRGSRLLYDSRGNLWVGTGGQGLWRVQHDPSGAVRRFQRTSTMTGMSDDGVTDLIEDRDGNIWVATRDGLNRLTPHKMTPIMDLGIVNAVDVTPDGRVWVGTADALVAFEGGTISSRSPPIVIPNPPLAAMHADDRGSLWIASADELSRIVNGRREVVPLRGNTLRNLTDITSDGAGGLWLHDAELGLWNWRGGRLTPAAVPAPLQLVPLLASYTDREGRAWFAYQNGRVARVEPSGAVRVHGEGDGLTAGPYRSIHQDRAGAIWFGGNKGLSRFAHGEFHTLPPLMATALLPVTGIVDDHAGNLWLALESAGLLRLSGAELARAFAEPGYRPRSTGYDKVDGSAGTSRWFGHRAAVRATDGRLWFVAGRGVTVVDPDVLDHARKPAPAVRIEGAIVDGRRVAPAAVHALPPRSARLQIDYTVLDLTSPLKTRFRHRLDGFDADWIDAGTNHSASYTNLPPRAYTFRVMATGDDGSFGEPAAEWAFSIEPMFYQTWWFAAACVAAIALAIGIAWRLHVLTVRRRLS